MQNLLNRIVKYNIYVLVFLLPVFWLPISFEIFEYNKQYLLFFLVSSAFFAWVLKQVIYDKEIKFKKSPIDYLVLGFLLVSLLSVIFSVDKNSSIFGFYGRFSDGLIGFLSFGALYFLITNTIGNKKPGEESAGVYSSADKIISLFLFSNLIVILSSYFSIFGIWGKINGFLHLPQVMLQSTFNMVTGSLEGSAVFLAITVVLLAGLLLNKTRIFYLISLAASLGLLIIIDFTPAWIILLVTLVMFLTVSLLKRIFKESVNRLLVPVLLIIIAATFLVWQPFKTNLPKEQVLQQSFSWQVAMKSATNSVKDGFLGSGLGTFHYDFAKYKPNSFNQNWMWQIRFDRAGSYFSELLGTVGFLGLFVYFGLIGLIMIISWFSISKSFAGLPLLMTFTALIVGQFTYYQNTSLAFIFWTIMGLSVVSWGTKSLALMREKKISFKNFPESSLLFLTLVIVLGAALLGLYFYKVKYYVADVNYFNALSKSGEPMVRGLQKAVNGNPNSPNYRQVLARAYLLNALDEMQKSKEGQDASRIQSLVSLAIDQARVATVLQPNQVANWETLGAIYREIRGVAAGATEWGTKSFEKAIELEPTNPVFYTELAKLYLAAGDKEKAKDNFNKALEKKPDYEAAAVQLALLLEQENNSDEAIARLENLIKNNPLTVDARFQLGRIYFNKGRTDEAIAQFNAVITLVPNHSNAHYSLGVAYSSQRKTQLAIQEFEKVLELNPGNADIIKKLKDLGAH